MERETSSRKDPKMIRGEIRRERIIFTKITLESRLTFYNLK
jgi:hypothetical protein